ncbi:MAG: methyl-accepting chemotaxis protein [Roseobacter sp.]
MRFITDMNIGKKLPLVIGLLVAMTIVIMSVANAYMTQQSIAQSAREKLEGVTYVSTKRVQALLDNINRDITLQAAAPATSQALIALADGYNSLEKPEEVLRRVYVTENEYPLGEKDLLVSADTGSSYGFIHAIYHPTLDNLQNEMNYYDIFLFDLEGNLVYSVYKENDFATNMLTGPWATSGLAESYRQAMELGPDSSSAFVDFAPYEPSNFAPAAFIARPVFNTDGTRLGVLAYQMPISELSDRAGNFQGLGQSADGFLVGEDRQMRSDSLQTEDVDILNRIVDTPAVATALSGTPNAFAATGHFGQNVMGYARPIEFLGTKWVTVVQQDTSELFSSLRTSILQALAISFCILLGVLGFSIAFSRSIARPIQNLTGAVTHVADGSLETEVPCTERKDEIGQLARKTEIFRQSALRMEKMSEEQKAASEKMAELNTESEKAAQREIEMAREKEQADRDAQRLRDEMMQKLGDSFGDVVAAALEGDFSNRVQADFDDKTLTDLSENINDLMTVVDDGLTSTGAVMSQVAEGNLTDRLHGDFKGSFKDLQVNVNNMLESLTSLVSDISASGTTLSGSSSELRETADVLSRQAEQNAAAVEETSAALEELTASIEQVNGNITDVSKNAQQASRTAKESEKVANDAADSMDRIAQGSAEITRVTGVINDIAFQINLLALNAGVEAARAGDAGRGFSVVASEVRQLAQRASEASKEISAVLSQSDLAVKEGVDNVANAKTSLENIAGSVVKISDSVSDVTRAISEQASGIKEISSSLAQVDSNTQKQAAAFEEVTASSHVLANEATELQTATERFKVSGSSAEIQTKPKSPSEPYKPAMAVGAEKFEEWGEF